VASGTNTTVRQVGAALGVAVIGSILAAQTLHQATRRIATAAIPAALKAKAIAGVHSFGSGYVPPASTPRRDAGVLQHLLQLSVTSATRVALVFAIVVVALGTLLSFLIPRVSASELETDALEPVEPMDVDPALVAPELT
jgi:hypothetical protein